ncbi:MAG: hypothetical protein ACREIA_20015 [Opitutaceae bacterium]
MSVTRRRVRLKVETADFDPPADVLTSSTMQFWRGSGLRVELGLFERGVLEDVANLESIRLEIKNQVSGSAPAPDAAALMAKEVTSFDNTLASATWDDGTKQHAAIEFTAAETNITVPSGGNLWMILIATTTDDEEPITLAAGTCKVYEDGWQSGGAAPPAEDTYYTAQQANARFVRRAYIDNLFVGELTDEQVFGGFTAEAAVKIVGMQIISPVAPTGADATFDLVDHDDSDAELTKIGTLSAAAAYEETIFATALALAAGGTVRIKAKSAGSTVKGAWVNVRLILAPVGTDVVEDPATFRSGIAAVATADDEEIIVTFATALDEAPTHVLLTAYGPQIGYVDPATLATTGFTIKLGGPSPAGRQFAYRAGL